MMKNKYFKMGSLSILAMPISTMISCGVEKNKSENKKEQKQSIINRTKVTKKSTKDDFQSTKLDKFEPTALKSFAQLKFDKFINKFWISIKNKNNKVIIDKFVIFLNEVAGKGKIDIAKYDANKEYGSDQVKVKIEEASYGARYIKISVGNKYDQLTLLAEKVKTLKSKPTYKDLINLFTYKTNRDTSNREDFDNVLKYAFGHKRKIRLTPSSSNDLLSNTNDEILDNAYLKKSRAIQKMKNFFNKLKVEVNGDFSKLNIDKFIKVIKEIFNLKGNNRYSSKLTISPHLQDKNVEGVEIDTKTNKKYTQYILKRYSLYGITSRRIGFRYVNSLGDKYNDISNWVESIKTKAPKWNSKDEISFKEFMNSFKVTKVWETNEPNKEIKKRLIKLFKISLGEIEIPTLATEKIAKKLPSSLSIDEDKLGNVVSGELAKTKQPGLSYSPIDSDHIKLKILKEKPIISFWNVLNLDSTYSDDSKIKALAKTIVMMSSSIVGLGEIINQRSLEILKNQLNIIDAKSNWKFIRSGVSTYFKDGTLVSKNQSEYYGFVYKGSEFTIKPFSKALTGTSSNLYGRLYENPRLKNEFIDKQTTGFVRPPFGVQFINKSGKDFTIVITHNDSPGSKGNRKKGSAGERGLSNKKSVFSSQGTQETWEALHSIDVMKYFDYIDGDNSDLIFMGDTNIKYDSKKLKPFNVFNNIIKDGYKALSNPLNKEHSTTLSGKAGMYAYANPYDRIFIKSSMFTSTIDPTTKFKKYHLSKIWSNIDYFKSVFGQYIIDSYKRKKGYVLNDAITSKFIRGRISDHAPISTDLDLSKQENDVVSTQTWSSYLTSRRSNPLSIPAPIVNTRKTQTQKSKVIGIVKKIENRKVILTLNNGYDLSKKLVQDEFKTKIFKFLRLTETEKKLVDLKLPLTNQVINKNNFIDLVFVINEGKNKLKDIILKVKKRSSVAWKNSLTFREFLTRVKPYSLEAKNAKKYQSLFDYLNNKNVPIFYNKDKYPYPRIFNLASSSSAKWIIVAVKDFIYDQAKSGDENWNSFVAKVKVISSKKSSSWSKKSKYTKVLNSFSLLFSDVTDIN